MGSVRVGIVGVGNCATSLIQGVEYYKDADPAGTVPGLMHVKFGDYHVKDVQFVVAFDVDDKKVGKDLSEAINASENNTIKIADVPTLGVEVKRGPTLDGLGEYYREAITESDAPVVDIAQVLRDSGADVLVCYLPVGSELAAKHYAQAAIEAGVAFVRAATAGVDPLFVTMVRRLVLERAAVERGEETERPALGTLGASWDTCPPGCCVNARQPGRPALCGSDPAVSDGSSTGGTA